MIVAMITTGDSYVNFVCSRNYFENACRFGRKDAISSVNNSQNARAIRLEGFNQAQTE